MIAFSIFCKTTIPQSRTSTTVFDVMMLIPQRRRSISYWANFSSATCICGDPAADLWETSYYIEGAVEQRRVAAIRTHNPIPQLTITSRLPVFRQIHTIFGSSSSFASIAVTALLINFRAMP